MRPSDSFDRGQLASLLNPSSIALSILCGWGLCAVALSSWGATHLAVAPAPVLVVTCLWSAQLAVASAVLAHTKRLPDAMAWSCTVWHHVLCVIYGAASSHPVSAMYACVPLGAMTAAVAHTRSRRIYALYLLTTPLLRLLIHRRFDSGFWVAVAIAVVGTAIYHSATHDEESRRQLEAWLASENDWANRIRNQPGHELAMSLHDGLVGTMLALQRRLYLATSIADVSSHLYSVMAQVSSLTLRFQVATKLDLQSMIESLGNLIGLTLRIRLAGGEFFERLPRPLLDDMAAMIREALVNAARHSDLAAPVVVDLRLHRAGASLQMISGPPRREAGKKARRGLRNLSLRAASWSGSALLQITEKRAVLKVALHEIFRPRWYATGLGLAAYSAIMLAALALGDGWPSGVVAAFHLSVWIALIVRHHRVLATLAEERTRMRNRRQLSEDDDVKQIRQAVTARLGAIEAAMKAADLVAVRHEVDVLADELVEAIAKLEAS